MKIVFICLDFMLILHLEFHLAFLLLCPGDEFHHDAFLVFCFQQSFVDEVTGHADLDSLFCSSSRTLDDECVAVVFISLPDCVFIKGTTFAVETWPDDA